MVFGIAARGRMEGAPWGARRGSARDIRETLAWIVSGAEIFRIAKPDTPPKHLIAYFMVIVGDHLLLVDHKNSGLWLPPGGHVDLGEHLRDTVIREAGEELGL